MKSLKDHLLANLVSVSVLLAAYANADHEKRPNILFAISDDQSYPHAGAYNASGIKTPTFDKLARSGVLFHNAFVAAPQCSPSRAAILTGKNIWQLEEAGTHGSYFPKKFPVFTRELEKHGYHVGFTGKPWGPGDWANAGWDRNPVGTEYKARTTEPPTSGISNVDYAGNFEDFLQARKDDQPFFFWYGCKEPHRTYEYGSGLDSGKILDDAQVPPFLPRDEITENDYLDYALEVEWFDQHLGQMLAMLEKAGELENTIIVVTADNGMPFPYAKANLQEFGTHVPFLISGAKYFPGGRETQELVSLIDLAPTFLQFAGAEPLNDIAGKSLEPFLVRNEPHRSWVMTGRERHTHARPDNLGYPARALRTKDFLYIWNIKPQRWPAGNPLPDDLGSAQLSGASSEEFKSMGLGYADIDPSPSKEFMLEHREAYPDLFHLAFSRRPEEQLYLVETDPWCLNNLSRNPNYKYILTNMRQKLMDQLSKDSDPRVTGNGDIFESYPRFGGMRYFPGFKERGEYNPAFQKKE